MKHFKKFIKSHHNHRTSTPPPAPHPSSSSSHPHPPPPPPPSSRPPTSQPAHAEPFKMPDFLTVHLQNQTDSAEVYAYITGTGLLPQHNGARIFVAANGHDVFVPQSPSQILQPLGGDVAIRLEPPDPEQKRSSSSWPSRTVRVPRMAGGRIWFSRGRQQLTFLLNPGPALVEPSVLNPTDPNADVDFCFAEFTLNEHQLFANVTHVDFVSRLPVALTLRDRRGGVQHVSGMGPDGLARVCEALRAQARRDGKPWDRLVVASRGEQLPLRVLSPTHGGAVGASFDGHFEPLVDAAWERYDPDKGRRTLRIDTQAGPGVLSGQVDGRDGQLRVGDELFSRPTTADILGCNSGPFRTGPSPARNAIVPRLAAAFQRSSLLEVDDHPSHPRTFYAREPANHYCRVVHEVSLDGKGYAFAYDDVQPDGGEDQSGKVNAGDPETFVVAVGGGGAYVGDRWVE